MIHVTRPAAPAHLRPADVQRWTQALCTSRLAYYQALTAIGSGGARPQRPQASASHYGHNDVRKALRQMIGSKCAYCEVEVAASSPQHVEHYRPSARYPALAYEWENLLLACAHCNCTYKKDQFPLAPSGRTPAENSIAPCSRTGVNESRLVLNPCLDDPVAHLNFLDGRALWLTSKGKHTIEVCGLNRDDLITCRRKWLILLQFFLEEYLTAKQEADAARMQRFADQIKEFVHATAQFAAMARAELERQHVDWRTL